MKLNKLARPPKEAALACRRDKKNRQEIARALNRMMSADMGDGREQWALLDELVVGTLFLALAVIDGDPEMTIHIRIRELRANMDEVTNGTPNEALPVFAPATEFVPMAFRHQGNKEE